jgi:hypothetical protein
VNQTEVRDLLDHEVAHEPPYLLDPDRVVAGGVRRRRARATGLTAALGLTAVAGAAAAVVLQPAAPRDSVTTTNVGSPAVQPPGPLETVIRAHTPASWSHSEVHETSPSDFQADVDDGAGPSRLYVGISPSPGSLQQHPCQDEEFAMGGFCREVDLDDSTRLITRGPTASGPVTSSYAVIVHRDGSGVDVGNDNATWPWVERGTVTTPEQKRQLTRVRIQRQLPVYSLEQLVEIAKALDAATSGR